MANYQQAFDFLIDNIEGGYQNDEDSKYVHNSLGERVGTNYGVTAATYERYLERPPSIADMQNMPRSTAAFILDDGYWSKFRLGDLNSQILATLVFDVVVQQWTVGSRNLQEVLNELGESLKVDGIIGNKTLAAANKHTQINEALVVSKYKALRISQGWLSRMRKHPTPQSTAPVTDAVVAAHIEEAQSPTKVAQAGALSFLHAFKGIFSKDHENMTASDYFKGGFVFLVLVGGTVFMIRKLMSL